MVCITARRAKSSSTATIRTIMEQTHLPIRLWLMAFAIMCSSEKEVSTLQLPARLRIGSYRSAWHMYHRIRHAMDERANERACSASAAARNLDETYVGGKARKGSRIRPRPGEAAGGRSSRRGGRVRSHVVLSRPDSTTFERGYPQACGPERHDLHRRLACLQRPQKSSQAATHTVNRSKGEYARDGVRTNEAEAFFALLKRGVWASSIMCRNGVE